MRRVKDLARGAGVGGQDTEEKVWEGVKSFLEKAGKRPKRWREGVKEGVHRTGKGRLCRVLPGEGRDLPTALAILTSSF